MRGARCKRAARAEISAGPINGRRAHQFINSCARESEIHQLLAPQQHHDFRIFTGGSRQCPRHEGCERAGQPQATNTLTRNSKSNETNHHIQHAYQTLPQHLQHIPAPSHQTTPIHFLLFFGDLSVFPPFPDDSACAAAFA
jgi:hypothetical protein